MGEGLVVSGLGLGQASASEGSGWKRAQRWFGLELVRYGGATSNPGDDLSGDDEETGNGA